LAVAFEEILGGFEFTADLEGIAGIGGGGVDSFSVGLGGVVDLSDLQSRLLQASRYLLLVNGSSLVDQGEIVAYAVDGVGAISAKVPGLQEELHQVVARLVELQSRRGQGRNLAKADGQKDNAQHGLHFCNISVIFFSISSFCRLSRFHCSSDRFELVEST